MSTTLNGFVKIIAAVFIMLSLLVCPITTPTPAPTDTPAPTTTSTVTPTPVVIVVTATPEPTPTVDPYSLVSMPAELHRFAAQLVPICGNDFTYAPRLGVTRDTIVYLLYESPAGSGQFHVARYSIAGDEWLLLDTAAMETPAPTPQHMWPEGEARK